MTTIKATVRARRLELDVPTDWPDGIEVELHPVGQPNNDSEAMSPEEIARKLAAMHQMEPLEMTDAEHAAWENIRQERIAREKHEFVAEAERLRGMWE